jgi:signal peptidase I
LSRARELWELKNKMDNKFYIKRLVAIGGDRVRIAPPHALINGGVLNSRSAFQRIYSCENGYHGYEMPMGSGPLGEPICVGRTPNDEYDVRDKRYLVFGDNTQSSYDGRYWGAFPERCLIGRAVFVYWPFTRRFGLIE